MQLQTLKISLVNIYDKDRVGNFLKTKNGKQYKKVEIATDDGSRMTHFCWDDRDMALQMKAGNIYDLIIEQNGQWRNFKFPTRSDILEIRVKSLEDRMKKFDEDIKFLVSKEDDVLLEKELKKEGVEEEPQPPEE